MAAPEIAFLSPAQVAGGIIGLLLLGFGVGIWGARWATNPGPERKQFRLAWALRIAGGLFITAFYVFDGKGGDIAHFYQLAESFWNLLGTQPADAWALLGYGVWNSPETDAALAQQLAAQVPHSLFEHSPQNLAFWRVCVLGTGLGFRNFWFASLWFTLFSFLGHWAFYRQVIRRVSSRWHIWVAIPLLWLPNTLMWTSGMLKEAWLGGLLCGATALVLASLTLPPWQAVWRWVLAAALLFLAARVKPYCAMAIGPCLLLLIGGTAIYRWLKWPRWAVALGLSGLCLGIWAIAESQDRGIHYITGHARMVREYTLEYSPPDDEQAQIASLPAFQEGPMGVLQTLPSGWVNSTLRPWPWESRSFFKWFLSIENLLIFGFLLYWLIYWVRSIRNKTWRMSAPGAAMLGYAILYLAFIGVSTPYFGTIVRYRAVAIPFLLVGAVLWAAGRENTQKLTDERPIEQ